MNPVQFDAFTRALATSTSRRQTLKIFLGAGVFLLRGSTPPFSSPALASQTQPAGITPLPENVIKGSCQSISNYREVTGVRSRNERGVLEAHPGYAGWTTYRFEGTPNTANPQLTSKNKVRCNCDSKLYDDPGTCLQNCKATLGCFSGICQPVKCAQTEPILVTFKAITASFGLNWQLPRGSKRACKNAIANWRQRIAKHENHHVADCENVARATTQKWKANKHSYTACGTTEGEVRKKLMDQYNRDIDRYISAAEKEAKALADQFHRTQEGSGIIDPDCSQC